jgi:hypothetical protein
MKKPPVNRFSIDLSPSLRLLSRNPFSGVRARRQAKHYIAACSHAQQPAPHLNVLLASVEISK